MKIQNQKELEKYIRQKAPKSDDLDIEKFPELIRNDLAFWIEVCKRNKWKYEIEVDWDGTTDINYYPTKRSKRSYSISFDWQGFIYSVFSDYQYDFTGSGMAKIVRDTLKKIEDNDFKLSELSGFLEHVRELCSYINDYDKIDGAEMM